MDRSSPSPFPSLIWNFAKSKNLEWAPPQRTCLHIHRACLRHIGLRFLLYAVVRASEAWGFSLHLLISSSLRFKPADTWCLSYKKWSEWRFLIKDSKPLQDENYQLIIVFKFEPPASCSFCAGFAYVYTINFFDHYWHPATIFIAQLQLFIHFLESLHRTKPRSTTLRLCSEAVVDQLKGLVQANP